MIPRNVRFALTFSVVVGGVAVLIINVISGYYSFLSVLVACSTAYNAAFLATDFREEVKQLFKGNRKD